MLPVYLETCGVTWKFTPKKSQWSRNSRNHLPVHSTLQSLLEFISEYLMDTHLVGSFRYWFATIEMGRYSPIFPNDSRIFFREKKTPPIWARVPQPFSFSVHGDDALPWQTGGLHLSNPRSLGFHVKKKNQGVRVSGCQGGVPWCSMFLFDWTHHGHIRHQTFRVSSRSILRLRVARSSWMKLFRRRLGPTNLLWVPGFSGPTFLLFGDLMPESFYPLVI